MYKRLVLCLALVLLPNEARPQTPEVIREVLSHVVLVTALDEHGKPMAIGSGFVIDAEGHIASNLHVIAGATSALLRFVNQKETHPVRSISAFSSKRDLVILRTDETTGPVSFGDSAQLQVGDKVLAFGNPEGLEGTVSDGIVSALRKVETDTRLIQITAAISPGSSGGPVIDRDGKVVGLATASIVTGQNLNFAIPIEYLKTLIASGLREMPIAHVQRHIDVSAGSPSLGKSAGRVKALDFHCVGSASGGGPDLDYADVRFSVQNNLDRDIRNVRILVVWKRGGDKLDYSAYLVRETIPANQAAQVNKRDKEGIARFLDRQTDKAFSYEVRVLDYEILESAGEIRFN